MMVTPIIHGTTCRKVQHDDPLGGYLHGENDDWLYEVDGLYYCGRCHEFVCASLDDEQRTVDASGASPMSADQIDPTALSVQMIHEQIIDLHAAVSLARTTSEALALVEMIQTAIAGLQAVEDAALIRANQLPPQHAHQTSH